jgi:flagellar hook-basal body complex protein FliE
MNDIPSRNHIEAILTQSINKEGGSEHSRENGEKSFSETLIESLKKVNELQKEADKAVEEMVTGDIKNIHETMIALSKADIAFRLTMQVRNKIIEAYHEIMRIQV